MLILATIDKLQKTTSLPNLKNELTKLHSVTSLSSEKTAANNIQMDTEISSSSSIEQKLVDKGMPSEYIHRETSSDKHVTDTNKVTTSAMIDPKVQTLPNEKIIVSPIKLVSFPERKVSDDNIHTTGPSTSIPATSSPIIRSPIIRPSPSKILSIVISFFKFVNLQYSLNPINPIQALIAERQKSVEAIIFWMPISMNNHRDRNLSLPK